MPKNSTIFFCTQCGNEFPKWAGQCAACHEWNTLVESTSVTRAGKSGKAVSKATSQTINEALSGSPANTFSTNIREMDRVLGPGLTRGGVYLMAGQPGIGKSTLLTQLAIKSTTDVYYVCSEENPTQVASRIKRLVKGDLPHIHLVSTSCVESVVDLLKTKHNYLAIVDSIQSVFSQQNATTPGSPSQVRDSASILIQAAKETNEPMIIVGHVTKEGTIAGPKMLEHMVDTVMDLSGDRQYSLRLLRTIKNRFGPTDETGIFQMDSTGLVEVKDPSKILLENRLENTPGSALAMIMEGTRPMTIEVQSLVVSSTIPVPRRIAKGISTNRLQLICAILTKHLHLPLSDKDVFVNITGGLEVKDPGADLAIAMAIISSVKDKALPTNSICFGELGLLGEIRSVNFLAKMMKEAKTLGYTNIYSPITHPTLKAIKMLN